MVKEDAFLHPFGEHSACVFFVFPAPHGNRRTGVGKLLIDPMKRLNFLIPACAIPFITVTVLAYFIPVLEHGASRGLRCAVPRVLLFARHAHSEQ